jgi:nucleoside-diphosphate-sugar epimerase
MMSFQVGYSPVIHALPNAPAGVAYRVGNPTLMHSLGYVPKISLEEGVSRALFVANQM